mmetsp:Transcript_3743/g.7162  ORF Transcript_3743/g.7162 Transcript_3743/m.7162 type:complete len:138 (+) Transcript_3743:1819-2232(+)
MMEQEGLGTCDMCDVEDDKSAMKQDMTKQVLECIDNRLVAFILLLQLLLLLLLLRLLFFVMLLPIQSMDGGIQETICCPQSCEMPSIDLFFASGYPGWWLCFMIVFECVLVCAVTIVVSTVVVHSVVIITLTPITVP